MILDALKSIIIYYLLANYHLQTVFFSENYLIYCYYTQDSLFLKGADIIKTLNQIYYLKKFLEDLY